MCRGVQSTGPLRLPRGNGPQPVAEPASCEAGGPEGAPGVPGRRAGAGPARTVRSAPRQLLGLCVATATLLTRFGAHFAVVSRVSPEGSPYKALHHWGEWGSWQPVSGRAFGCQGHWGRALGWARLPRAAGLGQSAGLGPRAPWAPSSRCESLGFRSCLSLPPTPGALGTAWPCRGRGGALHSGLHALEGGLALDEAWGSSQG